MKPRPLFVGSTIVALMGLTAASASAAPRAACSILTLNEVRDIVGLPVTVVDMASFAPTERGSITVSNCSYGLPTGKRMVKVSLMWGPSAHLAENQEAYLKRHKESSAIKGDVFVLTAVIDTSSGKGGIYNQAAGQKLLAAALQKL